MSQNVQQDPLNRSINLSLKNMSMPTDVSTSDLKQQEAINKALIDAGLPQNKLNALISMTKDHLLCNSDCQKERESSRLKRLWEKSQTNVKTAPAQEEIAEKNYYVYDKGYPKYQDLLFDRYSKTAEEMKQSSIEKHKKLVSELKALMANYEVETIYSKKMYDLLKLRKEENKELKRDIDDYLKKTQTSARKVDYENNETSWIKIVRTILFVFYYGLIVIYLLTSDYFIAEKYKSIRIWLLILCYFIFPWLLNWIIIQFYYMKKYIEHLFTVRPHKNVYEDI